MRPVSKNPASPLLQHGRLEAQLPQTVLYVGVAHEEPPQQLRTVVLDHHRDRPLIDGQILLRIPVVGLAERVMMPKVVGVVLDQMTRIVRFWSFAFLNNSIIAVQEKIPLYKVLKMLFRESAMDS